MKIKSFLSATLAVASVMTFTSCKEDTQPRLETPTEFQLFNPAPGDNLVELQEGTGAGSTINLTVSQPNYGLGVVTSYQVQVSFTQDFAKFESLKTVNTQAQIVCQGHDMAVAMCSLMGLTQKEDVDRFDPSPKKVYIRVHAFIPSCDYSDIYSNVVTMNIKPYFAVNIPAKLFVIGDVSGWDINNGDIYLEEPQNGVGSKIYSGIIKITPAQAAAGFRFYTELGDWENNSYGSQEEDNPISFEFDWGANDFEAPVVKGKGSFSISNWEEGKSMKMTVDMSKDTSMKLYITAVDDEE